MWQQNQTASMKVPSFIMNGFSSLWLFISPSGFTWNVFMSQIFSFKKLPDPSSWKPCSYFSLYPSVLIHFVPSFKVFISLKSRPHQCPLYLAGKPSISFIFESVCTLTVFLYLTSNLFIFDQSKDTAESTIHPSRRDWEKNWTSDDKN